MSDSTHENRRARWLAGQTGVHVPYLKLLPASETVRYASAAIAMLVSVASAAAGWTLVGSWSAVGVQTIPRIALAVGAGLAAAVVVWSIDRELISGDGHLGVRAVIGAVNALFVGEIVLLALFSPFVEDQLQQDRTNQYETAIAVAETDYQSSIAAIAASESSAQPAVPRLLVDDRANAETAIQVVRELQARLDQLNELRTAEVTGRIVLADDGQPLTSGQPGDGGLATESLDRQIVDAEEALDRAITQLEVAQTRVADSEAAFSDATSRAGTQSGRFDDDRVAAQVVRDEGIAAAEAARDAPAGLLGRLDTFHHAVWADAVLAIAVFAVHIAVFAAELSVVLWAVNDRRRAVRLYPELVAEIDDASHQALPGIARAVANGAAHRAADHPTDVQPISANRQPSTLDEELTGLQSEPELATATTGRAPETESRGAPSSDNNLIATPTAGVPPPTWTEPTTAVHAERLAEILRSRPVEVTLLCPMPAVSGTAGTLRPKQLAVLAYLALHGRTSIQTLRDAFWPTSTSNSASENTVSVIRRMLGTGTDGTPRLGGKGRGHLVLSTDVSSDWTRLTELTHELSDDASSQDRTAFLTAALQLIKGRPGAAAEGAPNNWEWLLNESAHDGRIITTVHNAADQLIGLARTAEDRQLIDWAIDKANLVESYDPPTEELALRTIRSA